MRNPNQEQKKLKRKNEILMKVHMLFMKDGNQLLMLSELEYLK